MTQFKPGDKVRVRKGQERPGVPLGHVFTVADVEHEDHDDYITVEGGWTNGATGGMFEDRFEKVTDAPEPEDTDDVEPEPLKGGRPAFNDDDVEQVKVTAGSGVIFQGLAVFEAADNGRVIVTPVPRCTSLFSRRGSDSSLGIVRCGQHQGHSHGHWTIGEHPATSWSDKQEYGRVTEGGAS